MTALRSFFSALIALDVGREERPLDRRHDVLDALVKMRGLALDLGVPFQRRRGQGAEPAQRRIADAAGGGGRAAAPSAGPRFPRPASQPPSHRLAIYMLNMSIYGDENIRLAAGTSPDSSYSHFEQII